MELIVCYFGLICFAILLIISADEIDKWLNKLFESREKAKQEQLAELVSTIKSFGELQKDIDELQKDIDKQLKELYNML